MAAVRLCWNQSYKCGLFLWWAHTVINANGSSVAGYSTLEKYPHIARLFCGEAGPPKPFREPKRHLAMYWRTSFILWNRRLSPLWRPGLPFGVYYSRTPACSIPAEGVNPTGAYIKLRKNPRYSKRREKFGMRFWRFTPDSVSRIMAVRKNLDAEVLKIQPCF